MRQKQVLVLLFIMFFTAFGCISPSVKPGKYVCYCHGQCETDFGIADTPINSSIGGETPQDVIKNCNDEAVKLCSAYNGTLKVVECTPKTAEQFRKEIEEEAR
ncbi:MAG: hypothetical protein QXI89_00980 [Candidatus Anstonellales archaeon]